MSIFLKWPLKHGEYKTRPSFPGIKTLSSVSLARCGMKIENILSMAHARDALRQRRLIGTPFAKKFLLDQEHIFKKCTKKMIENLDRLRESNDGKVDVTLQFMKYTFDLTSKGYADHFH